MLASLIPLVFVGVVAGAIFGRIISLKSQDHLQTIVRDHAATVDLFLEERSMALDLVARSYSREQITRPEELRRVFANMNRSYPQSFLDLGVIAENGDHLAYVGPGDLLGKNYRDAPWFAHVLQEGSYISDVFLGLRGAPHFIMAVRREEGKDGRWILRATINSDIFSDLVSKGRLGQTGDCFIVDRHGRYQTKPLSGHDVFDQSAIEPVPHEGIVTVPALSSGDRHLVQTTKWIKKGDWMLVVQQEEAEIKASFRAAMAQGLAVFAAGIVIVVLAAFFAMRHLFRLIEQATEQKEKLNLQLLQAGKLASLGEMAAGLAHEINNPLAIISTEQTNLSDLLGMLVPAKPEIEEMKGSVAMVKKQVARCKEITQKMLQFGRQRKSAGAVLHPGPQLVEIAKLMKQQARLRNVELCLEMEPRMPLIYIDPTELQQLAVNIINNAVEAVADRGAILVSAWSEAQTFHLTIEDTGPGIPPQDRERIFEPFYTTKPVGKGTGLGLSVCYGIATQWRGKIQVSSPPGSGAVFDVAFPVAEQPGGRTP
jgi:two-component system NtrC family sensor kinase